MPRTVKSELRHAARPFDGSGAHTDRHGLALDLELRYAARPFDGSGAYADRPGLALDRELRYAATPHPL